MPETFPNPKAVAEYLRERGWKLATSTAYNHVSQGKLVPGDDGQFHLADIEAYARAHLKRRDGSDRRPDETALQRRLAEVRRIEAEAALKEKRLAVMEGKYIPREDHERALALRMALFKDGLENIARSEALSLIDLVGGDRTRAPELKERLSELFADLLDSYAQEGAEFEVAVP